MSLHLCSKGWRNELIRLWFKLLHFILSSSFSSSASTKHFRVFFFFGETGHHLRICYPDAYFGQTEPSVYLTSITRSSLFVFVSCRVRKEIKRPQKKKPVNAFMLFMKEKRPTVKSTIKRRGNSAVTAHLGSVVSVLLYGCYNLIKLHVPSFSFDTLNVLYCWPCWHLLRTVELSE